jgi:hypothetical protein
MKSHEARIAYLLESVEALGDMDSPRRKVLLTLLYWKVFDGIEIPNDVTRKILSQGTNPETIYRRLRKVQERQRTVKVEINKGGHI